MQKELHMEHINTRRQDITRKQDNRSRSISPYFLFIILGDKSLPLPNVMSTLRQKAPQMDQKGADDNTNTPWIRQVKITNSERCNTGSMMSNGTPAKYSLIIASVGINTGLMINLEFSVTIFSDQGDRQTVPYWSNAFWQGISTPMATRSRMWQLLGACSVRGSRTRTACKFIAPFLQPTGSSSLRTINLRFRCLSFCMFRNLK